MPTIRLSGGGYYFESFNVIRQMKPQATAETYAFVNHLFADSHNKVSQPSSKLEGYHKQIICDAFKRCYGLKQLVQDGKEYAILALAEQTCFRIDFIKNNMEAIKLL